MRSSLFRVGISAVLVLASSCSAQIKALKYATEAQSFVGTPTAALTSPAAGTTILPGDRASFAVSGTCSADGRMVTLSGGAVATALCAGGIWSASLDFLAQPDGATTVFVDHEDAHGNTAVQTSRIFAIATPALALTPSTAYVGANRTRIFAGAGGVPPYTYQMLAGDGGVAAASASTAEYSAPTTIAGNSVQETFRITDARGVTADATVTVAVPGTLDTSFGAAGQAIHDIAAATDVGRGVLVQSDGKIVVSGYAANLGRLVRFHADGSLDTAFGTGGVATLATPSGFIYKAVQQTDGKLVVAGNGNGPGGDSDVIVARFNADGTLDAGFGSGGHALLTLSATQERTFGLALQSDGKIILGGDTELGATRDMLVLRLTTAGALDTSFGSGGYRAIPVGAGIDMAKSVVVFPNDDIVLGGYNGNDSAIVKITKDGALDTSFGSGGIFTQSFDAGADNVEAVALQTDGSILAVGSTPSDFLVFRVLPNGTLDASYGTSGAVVAGIGSASDSGYGATLLENGDLFAVGYGSNGTNDDFAACRLSTTGALDTAFNSTGRALLPVGTGHDRAYGAATDSVGRVLIGGWRAGASQAFSVLRVWP